MTQKELETALRLGKIVGIQKMPDGRYVIVQKLEEEVAVPIKAENLSFEDESIMYPFVKFRIDKIARTFGPLPKGPRGRKSMVEDANILRVYYAQDSQEIRADYMEYVYDNSFARRMRRKNWNR
jgi:hypothetical protein